MEELALQKRCSIIYKANLTEPSKIIQIPFLPDCFLTAEREGNIFSLCLT